MCGIEVAKVGRRIRISSVWTRQTVIFNYRASVSLECMRSPYGECRSVLYGFMKILKSVAIVRKYKMGGCEYHYYWLLGHHPSIQKLAQTNHPKGVNGWFVRAGLHGIQHGRGIFSWNDELDAHGFANWGWKTASCRWLKNAPLEFPGQYFSSFKNDRFASPKWSPINCP